MIDLKSILKLANEPHSVPLMRAVVFDGKHAIAVSHSRDAQPWWAGVPCDQAGLAAPVAVPVETIKAHFLRSRHLLVAKDHVHNGQGMRTAWDAKTDWTDALTLLPSLPAGEPVMFDLDLDALDRVLIASAEGDIRQALNGVLLDLSTGRMAGTDGTRLHVFERKVPKLMPKKGQGALHVLLPRDAARWLLYSQDAKASVTVWGLGQDKDKAPLVMMRTGDGLVYTASIAGQYPDILRVMRSRDSYLRWLQLDPAKFSDAVGAMGKVHALAKPKLLSVSVHWAQQRVYAGTGPEYLPFPGAITAMPGAAHVPAPDLWSAFHPAYLADAADCVTADARWCLPNPAKDAPVHAQALAVFDGDFAALVMPQRADRPPSDNPPGNPAKGPKPAPGPAPGTDRPPQPAKGPGKPAKGPKPAPGPARPTRAGKPPERTAKGTKPALPAPVAPTREPEPAKGPGKAAAGPGKPAARGVGRSQPTAARRR